MPAETKTAPTAISEGQYDPTAQDVGRPVMDKPVSCYSLAKSAAAGAYAVDTSDGVIRIPDYYIG